MASLPHRPQACPERWSRAAACFAPACSLAVAMAGCVPRSRAGAPPPTPEPEPEPHAPERPRLPADETRNRVAVLVPLTGRNAALGQSILNAANLALLDTGGQRIRITAYDTAARRRGAPRTRRSPTATA